MTNFPCWDSLNFAQNLLATSTTTYNDAVGYQIFSYEKALLYEKHLSRPCHELNIHEFIILITSYLAVKDKQSIKSNYCREYSYQKRVKSALNSLSQYA